MFDGGKLKNENGEMNKIIINIYYYYLIISVDVSNFLDIKKKNRGSFCENQNSK